MNDVCIGKGLLRLGSLKKKHELSKSSLCKQALENILKRSQEYVILSPRDKECNH